MLRRLGSLARSPGASASATAPALPFAPMTPRRMIRVVQPGRVAADHRAPRLPKSVNHAAAEAKAAPAKAVPAEAAPAEATPAKAASAKAASAKAAPAKVEPAREAKNAPATLDEALRKGDATATKATLQSLDVTKLSVATNRRVLKVLAAAGDTSAVDAHFAAMTQPAAVEFSTVIPGFVRAGRLDSAADYLGRLLATDDSGTTGATDNLPLFARIVAAVSERPHSDDAQRLLALIPRSVVAADGAFNRLSDQMHYIDGLDAKERYVALLGSLGVSPNQGTIAALISASAKAADLPRAEHHFANIGACGLKPDAAAYNALIEASSRANKFDRCFELARQMRAENVAPDAYTFAHLIKAASHAKRLGQAPAEGIKELLDESLASVGANAKVCGTALTAFVFQGDFDGARKCLADVEKHGLSLNAHDAGKVVSALYAAQRAPVALQLRQVFGELRPGPGLAKRQITPTEFAALVRTFADLR
eukprot:TRINITY_DN258_c0_g1_i1.p1 TRINITY_DN258_c0_g1~~TRINITY_DN258_c0_g1_i1.p1  ORF type:complete len:480 (-),score=143.62 TRINITY_DN258_c0_g1_i1:190-1629(-)